MKFNKIVLCLLLLGLIPITVFAASAVPNTGGGTKRLDLTKVHKVGNIWLRVSNYGFFGSGDDIVPQYPSLEYPGGSGIDYLYQGALWFGAKKYRRDSAGRKLYWVHDNYQENSETVAEGAAAWHAGLKPVVDTLVTVGFDGDKDLYEFLPAYNPLVSANTGAMDLYDTYNAMDEIATASTRRQKRGVDDDGDGVIDEDFVGYTFPLRKADELPTQFESFGSQYIHNTNNYAIINEGYNSEIWFPLGFMDLSDESFTSFAFTAPYDDDGDGRVDEDGAPVSEQDFISYYYDYCPLGTTGDRDLGRSASSNKHLPLNLRVRQMSYQWSYDYIKNLVYVEFNITNMNTATQDTLFDCAMGIYMDCDCGPQVWSSEKAADDKSGYVKGTGYEFAYTYDADGDGGQTTGIVGARVCTPDPEELQFHCWYWKVGDGPDDGNPRNLNPHPQRTANEKYWLLTGRNPNDQKFQPLRPDQDDVMEYEQPSPNDTRFLFAFYGDMQGMTNPSAASWNLEPGRTMKIVVAVFPGDNKEDLKRTARWAKEIYGQAQHLVNVVLPDTFPHYTPPEPPEIPKMYAEMMHDGDQIDVFWDNRSEFSEDSMTVSAAVIGWQNPDFVASDSYKHDLDSDPTFIDWSDYPDEFKPGATEWNMNASVNPFTGYRLRHDFQGYTIWGRSGSGSQEDWSMLDRWDKKETAQDYLDYSVNINSPHADSLFLDYGGYLGIDKGLPNPNQWPNRSQYKDFYRFNELYQLVPYPAYTTDAEIENDPFYGFPIYNPTVNYTPALQEEADRIRTENQGKPGEYIMQLQARLFKHPEIRDEIFDELLDTKLIPLSGHGGQVAIDNDDALIKLHKERLARRYYQSTIMYPRKGVEYYVAVTAYDRGIPSNDLNFLETGRDADANMQVFFPGTSAKENMDNIYVIPNPYIGRSKFDGRREGDDKGDKSRRLWFVNLPKQCTIRIYTLAGDLVQELEHDGVHSVDILTVSKATTHGMSPDGMHEWDLLSKHRQIIAPGVYLFSVENKADKKIKVGKFVVIK
ncbi:MAG: hypothetical protein GX122_05360 [Candidatus Cloacimonetes bacterium]|nr:hypothetical protein [Candidatus Cloacimonadota bacterium]